MFQAAYKVAIGYTRPVVLSIKTVGGKCWSSIGTHVVVNQDGHILTAGHIVEQIQKAETESTAVRATLKAREAIIGDANLDHKEKKKRLQQHPKPPDSAIERWSAWWGIDRWKLKTAHTDSTVDLSVGQLDNFQATDIPNYPVLKDPTKDINPGRSLCKLGFPFHQIVPIWDAAADAFRLPPDSTPPPYFPIDGIVTRLVDLDSPGPSGYPRYLIETSTPGLRGQSGGPTFDVNGAVWAIQSKTIHISLGFDPPVPGKPNHSEHQFINLGWGVHCETVVGMLRHFGVAHTLSNY